MIKDELASRRSSKNEYRCKCTFCLDDRVRLTLNIDKATGGPGLNASIWDRERRVPANLSSYEGRTGRHIWQIIIDGDHMGVVRMHGTHEFIVVSEKLMVVAPWQRDPFDELQKHWVADPEREQRESRQAREQLDNMVTKHTEPGVRKMMDRLLACGFVLFIIGGLLCMAFDLDWRGFASSKSVAIKWPLRLQVGPSMC